MPLGIRWIISEASIEWQQRRMYFVELHSSQWLSCGILNTPALNNLNVITEGELNMTFLP